jgi:fido (protein-threonine AMPylation protein)
MPRAMRQATAETIVDEVARHPDGIGVDALAAALPRGIARRTLQRRLSELVRERRLVADGNTRARRYRLAAASTSAVVVAEPEPTPAASEPYMALSSEGQRIKAEMRRPIHERRPVGYDQGLLEVYAPNRTFLLDASLRTQLRELGRSTNEPMASVRHFPSDIVERLIVDLSWASSRLEGNTYSRRDTERLIGYGQAAEGKNAIETQMILNHRAAIEFITGDESVGVDAATVIALHALLSDGLLLDPMAGGRLRHRAVEIGGSVYRPIALPQRLEELFHAVMRTAVAIEDPIEQAFFLLVHLPYLHPFEDVNKRVARVAANIPLMRAGLAPLSFIDVPMQAYIAGTLGVYELARVELLRDVFVWAYERACQEYAAVRQALVQPDTFRLRLRRELGEAIRAIVRQGLDTSDRDIASASAPSITNEEQARFAALVRNEIETLHEGNVVRFGLRAPEWAAWRERVGSQNSQNANGRNR